MPHLSHRDLLDPFLPDHALDTLADLRRLDDQLRRLARGGAPDPAEGAHLRAAEEALRRRALRDLPPFPDPVCARSAAMALAIGARTLVHYACTVAPRGGVVVDTVGSRTLGRFRADWDAPPTATDGLRDALSRALELTVPEQARVEAFLAPELEALDLRHRLIGALDTRYGLLDDDGDRDARIARLFGHLYVGQPLTAGQIGLVRTGTSLYFVVPRQAEVLGDRGLQPFLDRIHGFRHAQVGHFPVFGCFRGEGIEVDLLGHLVRATGQSPVAIAELLTTMVTVLPTEELDKYLWHDVWGHQWQSHLLPFEDDFRAMARFRFPPDPAAPVRLGDGRWATLAGWIAGAVQELVADRFDPTHLDPWIDALLGHRVGLVASGMVAEVLADVVEHKFRILAPERAASLPSSSWFAGEPTKADLMLQDLRAFQGMALRGVRRFARSPEAGRALVGELSRLLPAVAEADLREAVVALQHRCEHRLRTVFAVDWPDDPARANVHARMALNLLGFTSVLEDVYRQLEEAPVDGGGPVRDFRDLLVLSAGAFHQLDPIEHFWHLDAFVGCFFAPGYRAIRAALDGAPDPGAIWCEGVARVLPAAGESVRGPR